MALATLSLDITGNTSGLVSEFGKAAIAAERTTARMIAAQEKLISSLQKEADTSGRSRAAVLELRAAELVAAETSKDFSQSFAAIGPAASEAGQQGAAAFVATSNAAEDSAARQRAINAQLIASIRAVTAEYAQQQAQLLERQKAGQISPAEFKQQSQGLNQGLTANVQAARDAADLQAAVERAKAVQIAAAQEVAAADVASNEKRAASFAKLRATVAVLADKQSFQNEQAEAAAAKAAADAEEESAARRKAALQGLLDKLDEVPVAYQRNLALLQQSLKAGDITLPTFQIAQAKLDDTQNPAVLKSKAAAAAAKALADEQVADAKRAADAEEAATARFVESLQRQADAIGKTRLQLTTEEAARRGVTDQVSPYIAKLAQAEAGTDKLAKTGKLSAFETQNLGYQVHDFIVQVSSGQSPLTAFVQQGSQLSGTFGGAGGALRALSTLITPVSVGLGALALVGGGAALAFIKGREESDTFGKSIQLTGNFAGITETQFRELNRATAAATGATVSAAREISQGLISTGQFGPKALGAVTDAATRYAKATGQTAETVVAKFLTMTDGVAKFALEQDKSLNFLSSSQYDYVKRLEQQGKTEEAELVVAKALSDHFGGPLTQNLGTLERALHSAADVWHSFWDSAFDIGRTETIDDRIAKLRKQISEGTQPIDSGSFILGGEAGVTPSISGQDKAYLEEQLMLETKEKLRIEEVALGKAEDERRQKAGKAAGDILDGYLKQAKAGTALKEALAKADQVFADRAAAGTPVSSADQALIRANITKQNTDQSGIGKAQQLRKAQLDKGLKDLTDALQAEKDLYAFQNTFLQGKYDAGLTSLEDYFAQRRATTAAAAAAEQSNIGAQIALADQYLKTQKKGTAEYVEGEKQRNDLVARKGKAALDASQQVQLANQQETASYKQLASQVVDFRASVLQLQGDDTGAAALRAAQSIQAAQLLASKTAVAPTTGSFARQDRGQTADAPAIDVDSYSRAIAAADRFADVQRRVGVVTADSTRAEEVFNVQAEASGATLEERERGIYGLRTATLAQLRTLVDESAALAAASTDPKVQAFAADLALNYSKAAAAIDPALSRIRDATSNLSDSLTGDLTDAIVEFKSFGDVVGSVAKDIEKAFVQLTISDPLKSAIQKGLKGFTEGDSDFAKGLRSRVGVQGGSASAPVADVASLVGTTGAGGSTAEAAADVAEKAAASAASQAAASAELTTAITAQTTASSTVTTTITDQAVATTSLNATTETAAAALLGVQAAAEAAAAALAQIAGDQAADTGGDILTSLFGAATTESANGNVFSAGGLHAFQRGGTFGQGAASAPVRAFARGDIFNRPTYFKFASGAGFANGVMGEAGAEAVMPLKTTPSGGLGVELFGAGGLSIIMPLQRGPSGRLGVSHPVGKTGADRPGSTQARAFARGGTFGTARVSRFADGGVFANSTSVADEVRPMRQNGAEARSAAPPAPASLNVQVINNSPAQVRTQRTNDGGLKVLIDQVEQQLGSRIDDGAGLGRNMKNRYGLADRPPR